jgi:hypothetical protein
VVLSRPAGRFGYKKYPAINGREGQENDMVKKPCNFLYYNDSRGLLKMKKIIFVLAAAVCLVLSGCSESAGYYTLTFNGNGASGTPPPAVSVPEFQNALLPSKGGLDYAGKVFLNWNTKADNTGYSYNPGDKIQLVSDMVLYAQWEDKKSGIEYKTFWAQDTDGTWYTVEAVKRETGKSIIYVDVLAAIEDEDVGKIKNEYDSAIYAKITNAFGSVSDVDKNGKVILLLLDIKDGYTGSGGYVAGYFDATHMYDTETSPFSNKADMLFIDTYPSLVDWDGDGLDAELSQLCSTIAHELQHLINFSQTVLATPQKQPKDLWIDEGLSSAAEYIYDPSDTSRIDYFNASNTPDENGYVGTIPYGNNFFVWNGYWEQEYGDVLADYATVHLFFRWLGIHSGGTGIYKEIINNSSGDYRSVTTAAEKNIESPFSSWETLLGTWMLANYYNSPTGFYGYKNTISPKPKVLVFTDTGHVRRSFFPGEGIFSKQGSFYDSLETGTNIRYRGLGGSSGSPDVDTSLSYAGNALLTFNANTNKDGGDEIGYLASVAETGTGTALSVGAGSSIRAAGASADGAAYPVSFGDKAAGLDKPGKSPRAKPR